MASVHSIDSAAAAAPAPAAEASGDLEKLERLRSAWEPLVASAGIPMQDFDWIHAFVEVFSPHYEVEFVTVGTPPSMAIAPLCRPRRGSGGRYQLIGPKQLYESMDFLYTDPRAMVELAHTLAGSGKPLFLMRFPTYTGSLDAIREAYRRGVVRCGPAPSGPWIPLNESWVEPERHLNSGRRSDLRRAMRYAQKNGPVEFEIISPPASAVNGLLDEAYRVEAQGWKSATASAMARDPLRGNFYRRYAALAAAKGKLRICSLRIGRQAAAMQVAVISGNRFWLLKMGYDEAYSRCSPGMLLTVATIRYAAGCGLQAYELLGAVEPWTQLWTDKVHECISLRAYPLSANGAALLCSDGCRSLYRSAVRALREGRRT
jgi:CelD/BcsL family acetyltransferase involved in cellulose biosynthesis